MTPILDVVMLIHNGHSWADLAIRAVERHTKNPYRLIIVDNASTEPDTIDLLREVKKRGHTVLHLGENKSFSNGVNAGVAAGSSKYVCVLNDDAIVGEGWDAQMIQDASSKTVGLVGARSNFAAGAQGDPNFLGEPPFLVFVCVILRRQIWDTIGPMDEVNFDGFSGEDLDYSWRVKKAGYHLKVGSAFVLHGGSKTLARTIGDVHARAKNDQKYINRLVEKWGKDHVIANTKLAQRGLVVTYHAEEWTRVEFLKHLIFLRSNTGITFEYLQVSRAPIQMARQMAADFALDNGFDWMVQLDDDATFPPDVLRRLLASAQDGRDVVTALAYQRRPPHLSCVFEVGPDGMLGTNLEGIENTGLRKVDVSGFHCSVLRTSVIKKLRDGVKDAEGKIVVPGTRQYFGGFDNKVGEDFAFCLNLKKIGVQVWCDTNLIAGHIGSSIVVDADYKQKFVARGNQ